MSYQVEFTTKWSDFDPNKHMRHTAYNDYAAEVRVRYFKSMGFSIQDFIDMQVGPILFKEETSFLKEIRMGEDLIVTAQLKASSANGERWKLRHEICNTKGKVAAIVEVYGAWMDLTKRKLCGLPKEVENPFTLLKKTEDFEEIVLKQNASS